MTKLIRILLLVCSLWAIPLFAGVCSPVVVVSGQPTGLLCNVDASTSVTAGNYVKWNATKTGVTNGATTDTAGLILGIASSTVAGSSGNPAQVLVYTNGPVPVVNFDNTTTSGDYGCVSTSTGGQLKDCGATGNDQTVAWIQSSVTGAGSNAIYFFGHLPNAVPTLTSTSSPVTDPGGASYYLFNNAAGAITFNLPAGVPGMQRCYRQSTGKSGVITIAVTTSNSIDLNGANGTTSTGTLVSGGALGDAVCLVSDITNHWMAFVSRGTWSNL